MGQPQRGGQAFFERLTGIVGKSKSTLSKFSARLRLKRSDELGREQGQTIVRVAISVFLFGYLTAIEYPLDFGKGVPGTLLFVLSFIGWSAAVLIHTFYANRTSLARRTITNCGDVMAITYLMIIAGKAGIPLFVLYLWVTLGNGFRFGFRAMATSAILSLIGFSAVLAISPEWKELVAISVVIVLSLIALPLYSAHLVQQRRDTAISSAGDPAGPTAPQRGIPPFAQSEMVSHALGRERGQALTRLGVCTIVLIYLLARSYPIHSLEPWLLFCFGYLSFSILMVTLALLDSKHSVVRRTAANVADVGAISYLMIAMGETGLPLFILYLWITLGNGFRFGLMAMFLSAALSVAGLSVVLVSSQLWEQHPTLAAGILAGLILIPGYAAHLIKQLHLARQRAEEASAARGDFLARMSHELRTPLNGILGTTELLSASKRLSREDRSLLDVIRDSVKVSMRQIDNVLDFSKIEAGKLVIEQIDFDLHELLNRTVRLARSIALEKNLRLTLRVDPAIPYRLTGDPHHVQEILINLVSNAVKFTDIGYVSVDVTSVHAEQQAVLLRLEVHDTGIGIEPAALRHIFEAFSQAESGTTRRYGGTGLGTTIAKQLAELMGGRLGVTSIKDQGSVFYAEIPFRRRTVSANPQKLAATRVLLISENGELHKRAAALVQQWGVSLQVVSTAAGAEGLLRRGIRVGNPIHAVLADSRAMLTGNGNHCADDLLKKASLSFTPVFLLCDVSPENAQLRQWGYAGTLSYDLPDTTVYNALHASGPFDADSERGVVRVEPWAWGKPTRQRARLLVADDNRTNLMILRKILETASYEVDTAEDGEQALDMILRNRYKAAVLDMHMPGLDGIAVTKQYRMMHRGARTPIIMLTANATVNAKLESAEAGADAYLTKPATAASIIGTIERLLDDTEIHELVRDQQKQLLAQETPLLDTTLITELDRLYGNPIGVDQILNEFENESRRLLQKIAGVVQNKNHAAFCDLLHALKGNGANVGALRLAQACENAGRCSLVEFHRNGLELLQSLESAFAEAAKALRDFIGTGASGPARGSDAR